MSRRFYEGNDNKYLLKYSNKPAVYTSMQAMTNNEKRELADILRDHADMIVEAIGTKNGYQVAIDHLDPQAVRAQLDKWLARLP
jgi:hypothetical protein